MTVRREERRSYFRIVDDVGVRYSVLGDGEESPVECTAEIELSLPAMLADLDQQINRAANALWAEDSLAAQAIGLLNRKISLLAGHFLQGIEDTRHHYEGITASISGCGMAFHCREPLAVETRLRVWVALQPSQVVVTFTARVVSCERLAEIPARDYMLRLSIDEDCTAAREQLVQHVVQRQSALLSAARSHTQ
ncbi:MAG: PilZ domain-containing protein [Halioglobus sp.]|nr:PilZ domain-containing protein [Halioglobus sp.]